MQYCVMICSVMVEYDCVILCTAVQKAKHVFFPFNVILCTAVQKAKQVFFPFNKKDRRFYLWKKEVHKICVHVKYTRIGKEKQTKSEVIISFVLEGCNANNIADVIAIQHICVWWDEISNYIYISLSFYCTDHSYS